MTKLVQSILFITIKSKLDKGIEENEANNFSILRPRCWYKFGERKTFANGNVICNTKYNSTKLKMKGMLRKIKRQQLCQIFRTTTSDIKVN